MSDLWTLEAYGDIFPWDFVISLDDIFLLVFLIRPFRFSRCFGGVVVFETLAMSLDFIFCYLFDVRSLLHLKLVAIFFLLRVDYFFECALLLLFGVRSYDHLRLSFMSTPCGTLDIVYYACWCLLYGHLSLLTTISWVLGCFPSTLSLMFITWTLEVLNNILWVLGHHLM